jgi:hypothetical protein
VGNRFDEREARRARQRLPESYGSVSEWYADYAGFVPITMAHALSRLTDQGLPFHDAYLVLLRRGSIVEIDPWPRPDAVGSGHGGDASSGSAER